MKLDQTNDPATKSWVEEANAPGCHFPIQNLPFGSFSTSDRSRRLGVAIGDAILDLAALEAEGLIDCKFDAGAFSQPTVNRHMAAGWEAWNRARKRIFELLSSDNNQLRDNSQLQEKVFVRQNDAQLHLPFDVAEYTDFYSSEYHATNVGKILRGDDYVLPANWKHMPIAYNGRASTVVVSGTSIRRPWGQAKVSGKKAPEWIASRKLDLELELGVVVGTGNKLGDRVTIGQAEKMIFGVVLLNDWSARDLQAWESQPLGPFQSKAFATTISPWVVPMQALAPFRVDGQQQNPEPLPYLQQPACMNFDIDLEIGLRSPDHTQFHTISRTNSKYLYWSAAQQLTHHASSGCSMRTGDLLGTGTISGPTPDSAGSLLELSRNGREPVTIAHGNRRFLEDGDEICFSGSASCKGFVIGFGECTGLIINNDL